MKKYTKKSIDKIMYIGVFISLLLLSSCSKESTKEEDCKDYQMFVTSSEESARDKCRGLANNHPTFKVVQVLFLPCLKPELLQVYIDGAKKRDRVQQFCIGVDFEIKTIIK